MDATLEKAVSVLKVDTILETLPVIRGQYDHRALGISHLVETLQQIPHTPIGIFHFAAIEFDRVVEDTGRNLTTIIPGNSIESCPIN